MVTTRVLLSKEYSTGKIFPDDQSSVVKNSVQKKYYIYNNFGNHTKPMLFLFFCSHYGFTFVIPLGLYWMLLFHVSHISPLDKLLLLVLFLLTYT